MEIGELQFGEYPLFLAPMENVTDATFRYFCKKFGADLLYSEFVSSEALIRGVNKTVRKMHIDEAEHPYAIQLYGNRIASMIESVRIAETFNPDLIDLNFGCPAKKVAMKGAGAGMLKDVPLMIKMTREIVKATRLPVTVKTRLGWDQQSINIKDVAEQLQDTGIRAITIHGRTRTQMYQGEADWELIGEVKNNPRMHIPVIGNGDVDSPEKAKWCFEQYGVDAIMIGRAAIGRPWIFREIRYYLDTGELLPPVTVTEQVKLLRDHFQRVLAIRDEYRAILSMRRFFATSFKGLYGFRESRIRLLQATTPEDINIILSEIIRKWGDQPAYASEIGEK